MPTNHPILPDTRELPLHAAISHQAHSLWEKYGRPEGRDVAIWVEAERQILGTDGKVNQQPTGAVPAQSLGEAGYGNTPAGGKPPSPAKGERGKR